MELTTLGAKERLGLLGVVFGPIIAGVRVRSISLDSQARDRLDHADNEERLRHMGEVFPSITVMV